MPIFARAQCACLAMALAALPAPALSLEYRSIRSPAAVLYDAPAPSARKLFILSAGYPVEIVVSVDGWHKVRDATGAMAWVAADRLSEDRWVLIAEARVTIRAQASDDAAALFDAAQGVMFKVIEAVPGWFKVQHQDGAIGYVRSKSVWGG